MATAKSSGPHPKGATRPRTHPKKKARKGRSHPKKAPKAPARRRKTAPKPDVKEQLAAALAEFSVYRAALACVLRSLEAQDDCALDEWETLCIVDKGFTRAYNALDLAIGRVRQ